MGWGEDGRASAITHLSDDETVAKMGHPVLVARRIALVNTMPNLGSAEQGDSNIAAQPQGVAFHNHGAAIGISRLWVVDGSAGRVRGVACMKVAAKLKVA